MFNYSYCFFSVIYFVTFFVSCSFDMDTVCLSVECVESLAAAITKQSCSESVHEKLEMFLKVS